MTPEQIRAGVSRTFLQLLDAPLQRPRIVRFGAGCARDLGEVASMLAPAGRVAFVVSPAFLEWPPAAALARRREGEPVWIRVDGEPTVSTVDAAVARIRDADARLIIGIGGGSALDTAKAAAMLAGADGSVADYLEGGAQPPRPMAHAPLPMMAVPTTAGTGAEMTRNAVVGLPERACKRSLRHDGVRPAAALLDPELTFALPAAVTAAGGMDAITQLMESCLSVKRRPDTTALALDALRWTRTALPSVFHRPDTAWAREAMLAAASISGVCLAHAGLGLVHGVAAALGGLRPVSHGWLCGVVLPHALRWNREACPEEMKRVMSAFLGRDGPTDDDALVAQGIEAVERLVQELGLPPDLRGLQLSHAEIERAGRLSMGNSLSGNPRAMTPEQVVQFLGPLAGA